MAQLECRRPWPGPVRSMSVPCSWQCRGSSAGMGTGDGGCCWQQHLFAHLWGCDGSGVGSGPEMAASDAAQARLCLEEMDEVVSAGWVLPPRGMGGLEMLQPWATLSPLQAGPAAGVRPARYPGLLGPRRWQAGGGTLPCSGGTHARPQPRRQHFWLGGQSLSCRHRRRHSAAWSPSDAGGQSPGRAGTCGESEG